MANARQNAFAWVDFVSLVTDTAEGRGPRGPHWFCDGPPGGEHPLKRWPLDVACEVCGMTRKASRGEEDYVPLVVRGEVRGNDDD